MLEPERGTAVVLVPELEKRQLPPRYEQNLDFLRFEHRKEIITRL